MTGADFDSAVRVLEGAFPISRTSGKRTPHRNKLVGGHPRSWHLLGLAADYAWDPGVPEEVKAHMRHRAAQLGLRVVVEEDHDHLQPNAPNTATEAA